jgi:hypothetical protein
LNDGLIHLTKGKLGNIFQVQFGWDCQTFFYWGIQGPIDSISFHCCAWMAQWILNWRESIVQKIWIGVDSCAASIRSDALVVVSSRSISPSRHQSMYTQRERERELLLLLKYEKSNLTHLKSFNILLHLFFLHYRAVPPGTLKVTHPTLLLFPLIRSGWQTCRRHKSCWVLLRMWI